MERTTVYLDPALRRKLKDAAARRGISEAELVCEALTVYLRHEDGPGLRPVGKSTDRGVADRVDGALDELGFGRR